MVLLELCGKADFLLGGEPFERLKFPVESLHLLPQLDVVILRVRSVTCALSSDGRLLAEGSRGLDIAP